MARPLGLTWQTRNISVAGGVDTKTHPKLVEPPKTTTADNVVYTTNGAARKRYGYTALSTTVPGSASISSGLALGAVGSELVQANGASVYAYSSTTANWQNKGADSASGVTTATLLTQSTALPYAVSSATIGNYQLIVYSSIQEVTNVTTGQLSVGLFDTAKNTWLYPPVSFVSNASWPTVVAYGQYFYLYYITANNVVPNAVNTYLIRFDSATFASGFTVPAATLFLNGTATTNTTKLGLDAIVGDNGKLYVYTSSGSATGGTLWTYAAPGGSAASKAILGTDGPITLAQTGPYLTLTNPSGCVVLDTATLTESAPTGFSFSGATLVTAAIANVGGLYYACFSTYAGSTAGGAQGAGYIMGRLTSTRTLTLSSTYCNFPWPNQPTPQQPIAKAVYDTVSGKFLQWVVAVGQQSPTLQPTLYLAGMTPSVTNTLANNPNDVIYARAQYLTSGQAYVVASGYFAPRTLQTPGTNQRIISQTLGTTLLNVALAPGVKSIVPLAKGAFITGSHPMLYDGIVSQAAGFEGFPELPPVANFVPAAGGAMTASTTYQYSAVYAKTDAYGDTIYSAPTPPITVTLNGSQHSVVITPPANTGWPTSTDATTVYLYRTTAGDALNFHRLAVMPIGNGAYTDTASDASIAGNPFLYSTPTGELPNDPPPAGSLAIATQQRVFVVAADNPTLLYFSKPFNQARGAVEFNASSYIAIDPSTGPITALGVIDGNVIIFKAGSIYVLAGTGPDATGSGSFNAPARLAADDGCVTPASVLASSDGLYYLGARGVNLLDRSLSVEYVGASVESTFIGRTVTAAVFIPAANHARFFLDNGSVVVFDAFLKRWSTFSNYPGVVSATVYGGSPAALTSAGVVNVENTGFTDNGTPIVMTIETGWIPVTESQQGWGRLRRVLVLGTYRSSHIATLSFAYDWSGTYADAVQFSSAAGGLASDTVEQWRTRTKRQVMQAVRLKLVDSSITGESYDIVGLALEQATKSGTAKLPDSKSV